MNCSINKGKLRGFRKGDWKIKLPFEGAAGSWWRQGVDAHDTLLFNLTDDVGEQENLLASKPEKANEIIAAMNNAVKKLGELPPTLEVRINADKSHIIKKQARAKAKLTKE